MLSTDVQLPSFWRGPTYELEQISKSEILRKLKQRFGAKTIHDVRFRVGRAVELSGPFPTPYRCQNRRSRRSCLYVDVNSGCCFHQFS
jgi:hypothetical protein